MTEQILSTVILQLPNFFGLIIAIYILREEVRINRDEIRKEREQQAQMLKSLLECQDMLEDKS